MSNKDEKYMYEINRLVGERDSLRAGLRGLAKSLRADQQCMHTLIGDLCGLFPNKSPQAILGEVKQLQADNARLRKMLELAARDRIGFGEWDDMYDPLVAGSGICNEGKVYKTPLAALEAAYEEWMKREQLTA